MRREYVSWDGIGLFGCVVPSYCRIHICTASGEGTGNAQSEVSVKTMTLRHVQSQHHWWTFEPFAKTESIRELELLIVQIYSVAAAYVTLIVCCKACHFHLIVRRFTAIVPASETDVRVGLCLSIT